MAKKEWELALGERKINTGEHDEVLNQAVSDSRIKRIKMAEELSEAEHTARIAKLKREADQSTGNTSGSAPKKEPDSPVKFEVKGGVNLGMLDFDEERKKAAEELKRLKSEQDENIRTLGALNEDLREKIHSKEIEVIKISFESQMAMLNKMIEANASRADFSHQLAAAKETAALLGYSQQQGSGGNNIELEIKLREIEFNNNMSLRKFEEEAKDREIQRKIDLQKLEDEREYRKLETVRQARRDELFASFPEMIGRGLARGFSEQGPEVPATKSMPNIQRQPQPGIIAGIDEFGEADCANCGETMAIGRKATESVCARCGSRYPIKRVQPQVQPPAVNDLAEEEM